MFFFRRKQQPQDPPNIRLMKSMKFGGKDLTANRSGTLTDAQRRSVQRKQIWTAILLWLMALGMFALPAMLLTRSQNWQSNPGFWLMALMSLGCVGLAFWEQTRARRVLLYNETRSVSGPLYRKTEMVYTGKVMIPVYKITVDEKTFSVTSGVYNSFIDGEIYTLYYIPETSQLLSAELTDVHEKEKRLSDSSEEALAQLEEQQTQEDESLSY